MGYAGQKCTATSRVIAEDSIYDELCDRLISAVKELEVRGPEKESCQVGPLVGEKALEGALEALTADFSVDDPHRMMGTHSIPPRGLLNRPYIAWRVWVNITATCCESDKWSAPYRRKAARRGRSLPRTDAGGDRRSQGPPGPGRGLRSRERRVESLLGRGVSPDSHRCPAGAGRIFILGSSQSDSTAFPPSLGVYATCLLAEAFYSGFQYS